MTEQEAKMVLEQRLLDDKAEELKAGCYCYYSMMKEAHEKAIEALEKQIPKKPIDKCADNDNWSIMICPNCKRVFWNTGNSWRYEPEWCEKCGQRILWERPDWSEEE